MSDALHLVVRLGANRVAIPIGQVGSVIEVTAVTPVPRAAPHVAGLAAVRGRVITLIDCRTALGMPAPADLPPIREAVVVKVDGHDYGLIVDAVEDVVPAQPAPSSLAATLAPMWVAAGAGMMVVGGALLPSLEPAALIDGATTNRVSTAA